MTLEVAERKKPKAWSPEVSQKRYELMPKFLAKAPE
jgi:hypothetical protein